MGPKLGNRFREIRTPESPSSLPSEFRYCESELCALLLLRCCYRVRERKESACSGLRLVVTSIGYKIGVVVWSDGDVGDYFDHRGAGFCCDRAGSLLEEASEEVSENNNCERTDGHCRFIPSSSSSSSSTLLRRIVAVCSDSEWIGSNVYLSIYLLRSARRSLQPPSSNAQIEKRHNEESCSGIAWWRKKHSTKGRSKAWPDEGRRSIVPMEEGREESLYEEWREELHKSGVIRISGSSQES
jgi:hypothetical protein